jgi:hypothetical protein
MSLGASGTIVTPLGFFMSLANLARNLFGATPTDAVSCVSAKMAARICSAMAGPSPKRCREPLTSRKASSMEMPSTSGVKRSKISKTIFEAMRYFLPSTGTNAACGQRL